MRNDLSTTHVDKFLLLHSDYSFVSRVPISTDLPSSNFVGLRQLQIPKTLTKYYRIIPVHTETPHNATSKITNRYDEFEYHHSTLQKEIAITFEQGCYVYNR